MNRAWLFFGRGCMTLAQQVAVAAGCSLGRALIDRFPDGEISIQIEEDVRGDFVFVLHSLGSSDAILELLLLTDALRRCGPRFVVPLVAYFGYGRQERRTGQSPVSAQVIARVLNQSGADALVTIDLHSPRISEFISLQHWHLDTSNLFAGYIRSQMPTNGTAAIVSPDAGGLPRALRLSRALGSERSVTQLEKERLAPDQCRIVGMGDVPDLTGVHAILVDDIVSTGGTLAQAAQWLADLGAGPIWACVTHLRAAPQVLANRLADSPVERLVVTDSLCFSEHPKGSIVQVVSIAPLLASAVVHLGQPPRSHGSPAKPRWRLPRALVWASDGFGQDIQREDNRRPRLPGCQKAH